MSESARDSVLIVRCSNMGQYAALAEILDEYELEYSYDGAAVSVYGTTGDISAAMAVLVDLGARVDSVAPNREVIDG